MVFSARKMEAVLQSPGEAMEDAKRFYSSVVTEWILWAEFPEEPEKRIGSTVRIFARKGGRPGRLGFGAVEGGWAGLAQEEAP